jgi:hypothetical protein
MRPYNRARNRKSWTRLPPLAAWATQGLAADALFNALNRSSSRAFFGRPGDRFGTLHTIATEPSSKRVLIGVGGDASFVRGAALEVDFNEWDEGCRLILYYLSPIILYNPARKAHHGNVSR